jgi:CHAT domain-containing protein
VSERVYREIVDPLLPLLGGRTRLTILPDGVLHTLPFDALITSRFPRRYMIDDYTIAYTTFAGVGRAQQPPNRRWSVLAVGPPDGRAVAGAAEELAAVATVLGDRLTIVEGHAATAAGVRERLARNRGNVLHVATHAEANDASPDHARLAMAADSSSPGGWLHAYEIREWELGGALVVLSACETAAGRLAGGEGTLSLSRAFLQAGADGTVATLWPIGAPTAALMRPFYNALDAGAPTADALRIARLELRRAGYDHPFYWAPFVLTTNLSHFTARRD